MFATKRVKKDLRDLIKNPLPGISLEPTEDNLLDLHFTVIGPEGSKFQGIPFHGSLEIPKDYPNIAPEVYYHHYVPVGVVSWNNDERGFYSICMNINSNWESYHREWKSTSNDGWGPGNSLSTVLIQIQSAFFDTELFYGSVPKTLERALNFKCKVCHHDGSDPQLYQPEILNPFSFSYLIKLPKNDKNDQNEDQAQNEDHQAQKEEKKKNSFFIEILNNQDKDEKSNIDDPLDPICFATKEKLSQAEEGSIYGIGMGFILDKNNKKDIECMGNFEFEYLSYDAWNTGIERTSTKKKIGHWFPLYFNQNHWLLAKSKFEIEISNLFNQYQFKILNQNLNHRSTGVKFFYLSSIILSFSIDKQNGILSRFESKLICFYYLLQTIYQYKNDPDLISELNFIENQLIKVDKMKMINTSRYLSEYMFLIFLRPEKYSSLSELILNEIIYHNQDFYKSKHPDILDLSSSDKSEKVFICLKDTLSRFLRIIRFIQADIDFNQNQQLDKYLSLDRQSFKITSFSDFFEQLGHKFDPKLFEQRIVSVLKRPIVTPERVALYQYHHLTPVFILSGHSIFLNEN